MVLHADTEMPVIRKEVLYSQTLETGGREYSECATQVSTRAGQQVGGAKGNVGKSLCCGFYRKELVKQSK